MTCALYRQYGASGDLLYVGISKNPIGRQAQHMRGSAWMAEVARIELLWFASEAEALEAEASAIASEAPIYNVRRATLDKAPRKIEPWRARLIAAIEVSGQSQRAVSVAAGLSSGYVFGICSEGKDPSISNLSAICDVLGITVADILVGGVA